jgi:crotonobetainyl-CoA:carnitine CoA-transferase CaiB-like acyl-CoA transferase
MYLVMLTDAHWSRFCEALSLPQARDDTLATLRQRKRQRPLVEEIVSSAMRSLPFAELAERLQAAGVGYTEVKSAADVLEDPQAQAPGKLEPVTFAGLSFHVPNCPLPRQLAQRDRELPPPLLGEHTIEIMRDLGYDEAQCTALVRDGAAIDGRSAAPKWIRAGAREKAQ